MTTTYRINTTGVLEHSHGIAWTADLYAGDTKIGVIEQEGRGGADQVMITDHSHRPAWKAHCDAVGGEERATYLLVCAEDGINPDNDPDPECVEHEPVPYQSDGPLGHGWECGRCGAFLQAG